MTYLNIIVCQIIHCANIAISQFNLRLNPEAIVLGKAFAIFCAQAVAIGLVITLACTAKNIKLIFQACSLRNQIYKAAVITKIAAIYCKTGALVFTMSCTEAAGSICVAHCCANCPMLVNAQLFIIA